MGGERGEAATSAVTFPNFGFRAPATRAVAGVGAPRRRTSVNVRYAPTLRVSGWQLSPTLPIGVQMRMLFTQMLTAQHMPQPHWGSLSQAWKETNRLYRELERPKISNEKCALNIHDINHTYEKKNCNFHLLVHICHKTNHKKFYQFLKNSLKNWPTSFENLK